MTIGIGGVITTPALRRPLSIADGLTLRGQNRTSRPQHHHRIPPPIMSEHQAQLETTPRDNFLLLAHKSINTTGRRQHVKLVL
jgi:hypothetical protein